MCNDDRFFFNFLAFSPEWRLYLGKYFVKLDIYISLRAAHLLLFRTLKFDLHVLNSLFPSFSS